MKYLAPYKELLPTMGFTCALIFIRVAWTGDLMFAFLLWNLFLAFVPLYLANKLDTASNKLKGWTLAALWLLFFPNSIYIVTDLFHLRERDGVPLWFDLLLILSAALNGVIMGFQSLYRIEKWLHGYLTKHFLSLVIFILLFLCGYGIYLGRYGRWNSWDIVTKPVALGADIFSHLVHPFRNADVWILSLAFAVWSYLLYKLVVKTRAVRS